MVSAPGEKIMMKLENKKILSLSLPMAGIQLITVASGFLCMTMLAQLGEEVLAASALIFSIQMSIIVISPLLLVLV
jgi:Na+-driven multidrug efflux pump